MAIQRVTDDIDPENFFRRGESFFLIGDYVWRQGGLEIYGPGVFAHTTCMAFAVEVYMKVLVMVERGIKPLETHNLRELFNDLPPETRREVRRLWLRRNKGFLNLAIKQEPNEKKIRMPKTFEGALDQSAQAFIDWRYNSADVSAWHMSELNPILREMILKHRPDWKPPRSSPLSVLNPHPDFVKPEANALNVKPSGWAILNPETATIDTHRRRSADPKNRGSR